MKTKPEIRKRILEERDMLDVGTVSEKSAVIVERLCSLKEYVNAMTIMAYMPVRNEVRTDIFIKRCMLDGKAVAIPKVEKSGLSGRKAALSLKTGKDLRRVPNIPSPTRPC